MGYIIHHAIGTYYIEFGGIGGWSIWKSDAKIFPSIHEAMLKVETYVAKGLLSIISVEVDDVQQGLAKLADGDCTCGDSDGLGRCGTCEAAGLLNDIAEIARCGLKEIKEINEQQGSTTPA